MYFYNNLFVSPSLRGKSGKIRWNIKHNRGQLNIYIISLCQGNDLFDIFHCAQLKEKCFPREELRIIGIAGGYEEAIQLSSEIVVYFHKKYGITNFKDSFLENEIDNFRR